MACVAHSFFPFVPIQDDRVYEIEKENSLTAKVDLLSKIQFQEAELAKTIEANSMYIPQETHC